MKTFAVATLASLFTVAAFAQDKPVDLKDTKDKASYSIGLNIGSNLRHQSVELNNDALVAGLKDGVTGGKPRLTEPEVREAMMALQKDMEQKQQASGEKNKADGEKFLA